MRDETPCKRCAELERRLAVASEQASRRRSRLLTLERLLEEALQFGSPQYDARGVCLGYLAPDDWVARIEQACPSPEAAAKGD